ncbi:MAG: hypothetical protein AB7R67_18780 [Vicinamibacterales bacterium]
MPAPAPIVGHSPFARYRHPEPPVRLAEARALRAAQVPPLAVALWGAVPLAGIVVGVGLTQWWRQILVLVGFVAATALGAAFLNWIDPKGGGR